jgi:hypothetical protein
MNPVALSGERPMQADSIFTRAETWQGGGIVSIALVGVLGYLLWDRFGRKKEPDQKPHTGAGEAKPASCPGSADGPRTIPWYPYSADYPYGSHEAREHAREILAMALEVDPDQVVNSFFGELMASGYEIVERERVIPPGYDVVKPLRAPTTGQPTPPPPKWGHPTMGAGTHRPLPVNGITTAAGTLAEIARLEQILIDRVAANRAMVSSSGADMKDELFTVFETTGVFAGFADVHAGYAALVDDLDHGMEALKRALFLQWYARAEPGYITGIHRLYAESEWAVLQQLERRLIGLRTEPWAIEDEELICMLDCYDDIFGWYLRSLEAFPALQSYLTDTITLTIAGDVIVDVWLDHEARSRILMAAGWDVVPRLSTDDWLRDRGQMGVYFTSMLEWLVTTRPVDLTNRPAPYPTRDIVIIQADRFMQHLSALGSKRVRGEPVPYGYMMCAPPGDWAEIAELLDGPVTDPDESHIRHVVRNAKDAEVVGVYLDPARLAEVFRAIEQLDRHRSLVEKDEV